MSTSASSSRTSSSRTPRAPLSIRPTTRHSTSSRPRSQPRRPRRVRLYEDCVGEVCLENDALEHVLRETKANHDFWRLQARKWRRKYEHLKAALASTPADSSGSDTENESPESFKVVMTRLRREQEEEDAY